MEERIVKKNYLKLRVEFLSYSFVVGEGRWEGVCGEVEFSLSLEGCGFGRVCWGFLELGWFGERG